MDWAYIGLNKTVPRIAGPECEQYLSPKYKYFETVIIVTVSALLFQYGIKRIKLPEGTYTRTDRGGKRALLVIVCLVWGMEIGYKFSTRTVIWLLNPCHIATLIQIYLLAAPPSKTVNALFRFHLNLLNGPLLSFLFPETDTRVLPLETATFYMHHGMIFVVAYYLLRLGGVYNVEKLTDFSWNTVSYSIWAFYSILLLQPIAIQLQANLNHVLCPAVRDPFEGPYYRISAFVHQFFLCTFMCKVFCLVSAFFLTKFGPTKLKKTLCCDVSTTDANGNVLNYNNNNYKQINKSKRKEKNYKYN